LKQLRKRLTYANVMSSIAVFLVLGGATAIAANQLGKNSVGTKQLKKNAVTAAKIKNNAVTTAKIKNNAVTTAKIKDNAVDGAKVNESTLGQVPSAAVAGTATSAAVAGKVNGVSMSKLNVRSAGGTPETDVFNNGHLRVTFACDGAGQITVNAYTASDHASVESYGNSSDASDPDFNVADNPQTISSSDEQRDLVYTDESGNVVHLSYLAQEVRPSGPKCIFAGFVEDQ
jgi:hypothetical protein